jgi:hypothetical protein
MSELGRFVPGDRDLLTGLFYRAGYWISHIDDTDLGTGSEEAERAQMVRVLTKISRADATAPLVRELAEEALRQQASWARWEKSSDDILADATRCAKLVKAQGTLEELQSFRRAVMLVATSVARAVREDAEHGDAETESGFSWLSEKVGAALMAVTDRGAYQDMNISPAEDTALTELLEALKG